MFMASQGFMIIEENLGQICIMGKFSKLENLDK